MGVHAFGRHLDRGGAQPPSGGETRDGEFGWSLALSADGNTALSSEGSTALIDGDRRDNGGLGAAWAFGE